VPDYLPAFLDLRERPCLVVGGGEIGERKARELLACQASLTVVSPCLTRGLQALAESRAIAWRPRTFLRSDVRRCTLVIAATGVPAVDETVAAEARRRGVLVNVVDRPGQCDFIFGSILRRGELQIAVSTGGRSPALAREIRRRLESAFGPEYAELVEQVGQERRRARESAPTPEARLAVGERVVALALSGARPFARGGRE
jgi:siroheme synthase-like protein